MIWSYFDLAWHNLQTISEWFGVGIEVAEFGAHETRHEVLCCFCNASCISRYLLLCTWGWEPGMVQRVSNVKVCSSALCAPAPAVERDLCREYTDCSTAAGDWCSQTAVGSAAWELQPQLHSTGCSLPSHWLGTCLVTLIGRAKCAI